ncbi:MAG: hypothetical protein JNM66_20265 [Bryobacterales bacterium]|nr:hypothetical protein [Bryobacterales bacterium]
MPKRPRYLRSRSASLVEACPPWKGLRAGHVAVLEGLAAEDGVGMGRRRIWMN